jgi:hypothetical protein
MECIARYFVFLVEMCTLLNSIWRVNAAYFLVRFWEQKVKFKNSFINLRNILNQIDCPDRLVWIMGTFDEDHFEKMIWAVAGL